MVYFTIYIKDLHNSTGYIDTALEDDQLLKDYLQFLDVGIKTYRKYAIANPAGTKGRQGVFTVNLSDITAITVMDSE